MGPNWATAARSLRGTGCSYQGYFRGYQLEYSGNLQRGGGRLNKRGIDGQRRDRHGRLAFVELRPELPQQFQRPQLAEFGAIRVADPALLLLRRHNEPHKMDLAAGCFDLPSCTLREVCRNRCLRREGENGRTPCLCRFTQHRQPELLAKSDGAFAAERKDRC